jgi:hypothetical protein
MSGLPPTSTLASKPAQKPGSSTTGQDLPLHGEPRPPETGRTGATSATPAWHPDVNRRQSWNQQDLKRLMHEEMVSPTEDDCPGFTEDVCTDFACGRDDPPERNKESA